MWIVRNECVIVRKSNLLSTRNRSLYCHTKIFLHYICLIIMRTSLIRIVQSFFLDRSFYFLFFFLQIFRPIINARSTIFILLFSVWTYIFVCFHILVFNSFLLFLLYILSSHFLKHRRHRVVCFCLFEQTLNDPVRFHTFK